MGIIINGQNDTIGPVDNTMSLLGTVSIGGTMTIEDFTNIDSVGLITARNGIDVTGGTVTITTGANSASPAASGDNLVIKDSDGCGLSILSGNGNSQNIYLGSVSDNDAVRLEGFYNSGSPYFNIYTAGSERFRIDSSGRLLLGTTTEGKTEADNLTIADSGDCGLTLRSGTSNYGAIYFSDATSGAAEYDGFIDYHQGDRNFRFGTAQAERMRIKSDGDVYIGNIAHSNDAGANSSYRTLTLADITNGAQLHLRGQSPKLFLDVTSGGNGEIYYDTGDLRILSGEPGGTSSEKVRITSGGDMGLGTASPTARLDVRRDDTDGKIAEFHQSTGYGIQIRSSESVATIRAEYNQALVFETGTTATERVRITSDGKFGIGTDNPGSKLTVYETGGNAKLQLQRANTASNTDDYGSVLWRSAAGTAVGGINVARATAENDGYMFFQTTSGGTMSEKMRIQPSGYIGIGEVAPGGRLTVKHANTSTSGLNATLKLKQGVATNGNRSSLIFSSLDDFDVAAVNGVVDTHSGTAANNVGHLEFWTKESGNATAQEQMRVHPTGQVSINSTGWMGRFHIQQDAITEPPLSIRHHDASFYKHIGTAGPNDRNGTNASNGGTYLHVRVRTVWNDSSMTMFRITGYYPYSDYTHSFVGMYRYGSNPYRTNPYGQTINNLKRATIHSVYNEAASPGYLVFVCDWPTNYTGLMFEHIGAGDSYGAYMQNDLEIIDSLRSTGTSALTF